MGSEKQNPYLGCVGYDMVRQNCYDILLHDTWFLEYLFFKTQKYNKVPQWYEISIRSHMWSKFKKPCHICNLFSYWPLSNCCHPLWDSLHTPRITITYTYTPYAILLHWKISSIPSIHHKKKLHVMSCHVSLYPNITPRIWAIQRGIKDMLKESILKKRIGPMKI